jgi:hypothetical protein
MNRILTTQSDSNQFPKNQLLRIVRRDLNSSPKLNAYLMLAPIIHHADGLIRLIDIVD